MENEPAVVEMTILGTSLPAKSAHAKVTGAGQFVTDLRLADEVLHAAVLRSPVPHARVTALDVADAREVPGVAAVLSRAELGLDDRARQYGDVLAAVAASSRRAALEAAGMIEYRLQDLPAVLDPLEARKGPTLYDDRPDNVALAMDEIVGDPDTAFAEAHIVHEATYRTGRPTHCNLGRHCCIARIDDDGIIEVVTSVDSPKFAREQLARAVGVEPSLVRLVLPELLTSSFGGRSEISPMCEPVAVRLSQALGGQPVQLLYDPEEEFVAGHTRHATTTRIRSAATAEGRLTALDVDVVIDHGPFPNFVARIVLANFRDRAFDLYEFDSLAFHGIAALTNNPNAAEMRGIGVTQFMFVLQSHLDELSWKLDIDPVEFHRRNAVRPGRVHPISGATLSDVSLERCLDVGADSSGWTGPVSSEGDAPYLRRGSGMAVGTYTTGLGTFHGPDHSSVRLEITTLGNVRLIVGAPDSGQGGATIFAQIVADVAGIPYPMIEVVPNALLEGLDDPWGSVASRGAYVVGGAVRVAALALRSHLDEAAAELFDVSVGEVTVHDDGVRVVGDRPVGLEELLQMSKSATFDGFSETNENPRSYAAYFADVTVDVETGIVRVDRIVAAIDVGYALHPGMCEGQVTGAVAMGVEFALGSDLRLDDGVPMNASFAEYRVSLASDLPDVVPLLVQTSGADQHDVKGVGTPAIVAAAPAVCNAIRSAVGVRTADLPVRPHLLARQLSG
ncbi:MAG: xanthine dehydrogenase family protein molybdopterin-binding subunit [Dehalococcoidia bacterium]